MSKLHSTESSALDWSQPVAGESFKVRTWHKDGYFHDAKPILIPGQPKSSASRDTDNNKPASRSGSSKRASSTDSVPKAANKTTATTTSTLNHSHYAMPEFLTSSPDPSALPLPRFVTASIHTTNTTTTFESPLSSRSASPNHVTTSTATGMDTTTADSPVKANLAKASRDVTSVIFSPTLMPTAPTPTGRPPLQTQPTLILRQGNKVVFVPLTSPCPSTVSLSASENDAITTPTGAAAAVTPVDATSALKRMLRI